MSAHVVVLHRWRAPYALYESYLDHLEHRVSYVTTTVGRAGVPDRAAGVEIVSATDDIVDVHHAVQSLIARHGAPTAIVALKEDDLLAAAHLTQLYDLPGRRPADLQPFRDKLTMAGAVQAAGLAQPAFAGAVDASDILAFGRRHGWPVVVKPRIGSSSEGVRVVHENGVDPSWRAGAYGALVQSYVDGTLVHVDGVFDGREIGACRTSRYLGSPLDFRSGVPVGSVEVDDPVISTVARRYAAALLPALSALPTVFHLELFVRVDDRGDPYCVFVEIGARAGGAETPFLWREVHGLDLVGEAFGIALGESPSTEAMTDSAAGDCAGLLLVPAPATRPCRITSVRPVLGTPWAPPELYAEETWSVGDVVPDAPAYYEHLGGRFRFRGACTTDVENAVAVVARRFSVSGDHLDTRATESV